MGSLALTGGLAATTGYLYLKNEADHPVVEHIQVPIKDLHSALDGFTIAVMADFHLYPLTQLELIIRAVQIANDLKPDLTVLLGDYVWRDVEAVYELAPVLAGLNAKYGVFSIVGNHDHWTNVNLITSSLREVGLPVLINQGIPLAVGAGSLHVAGLDDGWSGQPDIDLAMSNHKPGSPTILLLHEPDLADKVSVDKRMVLQLAGHSHGGQIRFPGVGAIILPYLAWKYDYGLYNVNDMWLYTNRGLGVTNEPIRYNCPPEISSITLTQF